MDSNNRYSYPQCPLCDRIGADIENDIKECAHNGCQVEEYWLGGYTLLDHNYFRPTTAEISIHPSKHRN